jgi:hypothetical protein
MSKRKDLEEEHAERLEEERAEHATGHAELDVVLIYAGAPHHRHHKKHTGPGHGGGGTGGGTGGCYGQPYGSRAIRIGKRPGILSAYPPPITPKPPPPK